MASILLVDDDQDILELFHDLLSTDFKVEKAESGSKPFNFLMKRAFDIAITDLFMPEMDGLDLAHEIRKRSSMPIVGITGASDKTKKLGRSSQLFCELLSKPIGHRDLVKCVEKYGNK